MSWACLVTSDSEDVCLRLSVSDWGNKGLDHKGSENEGGDESAEGYHVQITHVVPEQGISARRHVK